MLAAGAYTADGPDTTLLAGPLWDRSGSPLVAGARLRRTLDLRTGVLAEEISHRASVAQGDPLRLAGPARDRRPARGGAPAPDAGRSAARCSGWSRHVPAASIVEGRSTMSVEPQASARIVAAAERDPNGGSLARTARPTGDLPCRAGRRRRSRTASSEPWSKPKATGFDRLLVEQRAAWAGRWADADIRIEGDDELERAVRFGLFHLMGSVGDSGEAAVGARGDQRQRLSRSCVLG